MAWKQIKIFTSDTNQSVIIEPDVDQEKKGLCMYCNVEYPYNEESFILYMSNDEAKKIGEELIKYANEIKTNK